MNYYNMSFKETLDLINIRIRTNRIKFYKAAIIESTEKKTIGLKINRST
jgi:hypothetical protein